MLRIVILSLCVICGVYSADPASTKWPKTLTTVYNIGDYAQGGVIYWLTSNGQHGLVASIEDLDSGTGLPWSLIYSTVGATANGIAFGVNHQTPGKINTELIVAAYGQGTNYAAGACTAYRGGGYDDWYLPSLDELGLMMARQSIINAVSQAQGGFPLQSQKYWSSFESETGLAWYQDFSNAYQLSLNKSNVFCVRAVRTF